MILYLYEKISTILFQQNIKILQLPGEKEEKPKDLPPVKEKEVPMSDKDPKNASGCVVS